VKPAKPMQDSLRRKVWSADNGAIRKDGKGMAVEQLVLPRQWQDTWGRQIALQFHQHAWSKMWLNTALLIAVPWRRQWLSPYLYLSPKTIAHVDIQPAFIFCDSSSVSIFTILAECFWAHHFCQLGTFLLVN